MIKGRKEFKNQDTRLWHSMQILCVNLPGPVAVLLHEHVSGRNYVKGMTDNIALYKNGVPGALKKVYYGMQDLPSS